MVIRPKLDPRPFPRNAALTPRLPFRKPNLTGLCHCAFWDWETTVTNDVGRGTRGSAETCRSARQLACARAVAPGAGQPEAQRCGHAAFRGDHVRDVFEMGSGAPARALVLLRRDR